MGAASLLARAAATLRGDDSGGESLCRSQKRCALA
jgi:hypothetical protein